MERLSDFERLVSILDHRIKPIENTIIDWALDKAMPNIALRRLNNMAVCVKCHAASTCVSDTNKIVCHDCGTELYVIDLANTRKSRLPYSFIFCIAECLDGIQLIRTFKLACNLLLAYETETFRCKEVCRHWISTDGQSAVTALPLVMGRFIGFGKFHLRNRNRILYDYYADIADVYPGSIFLDKTQSLLDSLNRNLPQKSLLSFIMQLYEDGELIDNTLSQKRK